MTSAKSDAIIALNRFRDVIPMKEYQAIALGLGEIEPISNRDIYLENLWSQLGNIPVSPETEHIEAPFLGFPAGTPKEDIWYWFDVRHSRGVHYLLYHEADSPDWYSCKELLNREVNCFECESKDCALNNQGVCCYSLVHGRRPIITDEDGCTEGACK